MIQLLQDLVNGKGKIKSWEWKDHRAGALLTMEDGTQYHLTEEQAEIIDLPCEHPLTMPFSSDNTRNHDDIYDELLEKYPFLEDEDPRIILGALTQSGKGEPTMALLWTCIYKKNLHPVLLVDNRIQLFFKWLDLDFRNFNRWLRSRGETRRLIRWKAVRGDVDDDETEHKAVSIAMLNPASLRKVATEGKDYVVLVDEADVAIKNLDRHRDKTKTGTLFYDLIENAKQLWMITATFFGILNLKEWEGKTILLPPSDQYRGLAVPGILDSNRHKVHHEHPLPVSTAKEIRKNVEKLVPLIEEAIQVSNVEGRAPYGALLVVAPRKIRDQTRLAQALAQKGIVSHIINSDGPSPVKRMNLETKTLESLETVHSVADLFDLFQPVPGTEEDEEYKQYKQYKQYKHHVIIAHGMATRGISFRPHREKGTGGLNGMIFLPCDAATCATRLQTMGRICGNFSNGYPDIHIWTSRENLDDMKGEMVNLYKTWAEANKEPGVSREQIEGTVCFATGKHDRRSVDDTTLQHRKSFCGVDYPTKEACLQAIPTSRVQVMTMENLLQVPLEGFHEGIRLETDRRPLRRAIYDRAGLSLDKDGNPVGGFNMAWDFQNERWNSIHNILARFEGANLRWAGRYSAGPSADYSTVNIIEWKRGFYEEQREGDRTIHLDDDTAYVFQTLEGRWRYFSKKENRKVGVLQHP